MFSSRLKDVSYLSEETYYTKNKYNYYYKINNKLVIQF